MKTNYTAKICSILVLTIFTGAGTTLAMKLFFEMHFDDSFIALL